MSISPVSDIVLDVAKAADPAKFRTAAERLSTVGAASPVRSAAFADTLNNIAASAPDQPKNARLPSLAPAKLVDHPNAPAKAYKGLEQLVLKNLVESMLPKESAVLFGSGTAGDIWRSMLADQLASKIGEAVELGSARSKTSALHSASHTGEANKRVSLSVSGIPFRNET